MTQERDEYQSYLLRLRLAREEDRVVWRASLQPIPDGPQRGFADLSTLFAFLEAQTRRTETTRLPGEDG